MKKIYLSGPLFTEAEQDWHRSVKKEIERHFKDKVSVIWPFELFDINEIKLMGQEVKYHIFNGCRTNLESCDILIALLDGTQVDDGTSWEIGYFFAIKPDNPIIGIRTDFRNAGDTNFSIVNVMIEASCSKIVSNRKALLIEIERILII